MLMSFSPTPNFPRAKSGRVTARIVDIGRHAAVKLAYKRFVLTCRKTRRRKLARSRKSTTNANWPSSRTVKLNGICDFYLRTHLLTYSVAQTLHVSCDNSVYTCSCSKLNPSRHNAVDQPGSLSEVLVIRVYDRQCYNAGRQRERITCLWRVIL